MTSYVEIVREDPEIAAAFLLVRHENLDVAFKAYQVAVQLAFILGHHHGMEDSSRISALEREAK